MDLAKNWSFICFTFFYSIISFANFEEMLEINNHNNNMNEFAVGAAPNLNESIKFKKLAMRSPAESIPSDLSKIIEDTVFEVVQLKIDHNFAKFEKPLPLDLLPYSIRTDKYVSIGTAFETSGGKFISAAHVIDLKNPGYNDQYFIRDRKNNIFELASVEGYSINRDYIIFTVKGRKPSQGIKIAQEYTTNQKIYTVGNAQGEGVVVREGLLTSTSKEPENGEWEFLRFSAPASSGNSGGPLLNSKGEVVGVVTMKNPTENLNYALPIQEIFQKNRNKLRSKIIFKLMNSERYSIEHFEKSYNFPKPYKTYWQELSQDFSSFLNRMYSNFIKLHGDTIFPKGKAALKALAIEGEYKDFPALVAEVSGEWNSYRPKEIKTKSLDNDGIVEYGALGEILLAHFKLPKGKNVIDFLKNGESHSAILAEGFSMGVSINGTETKITSLGKSDLETTFEDYWGRVWIIRSWKYPIVGKIILTASLAVPNGFATQCLIIPAGEVANHLIDLKSNANFIFSAFRGNLRQWQEFAKIPSLYLPNFLKSGQVKVNSDSISVNQNPLKVKLLKKNMINSLTDDLSIVAWPKVENGKFRLEIFGISDVSKNEDGFFIFRTTKPYSGAEAYLRARWEMMTKLEGTYNGVPYQKDGFTGLNKLIDRIAKLELKDRENLPALVYISLMSKGNKSEKELTSILMKANASLEAE